MRRAARGAFAVFLLLYLAAAAGAQTMRLDSVLVLRPSTEKPAGPVDWRVMEGDRGARKGQYLFVLAAGPRALGEPLPSGATRYELLSPQTVGPLPDVDVLGIHNIKVRPDRREAFDRFVRDRLHPAVGNLRPDLRLLYYKGIAGPEAGSYITIFALTRASRDAYWPGGTDSDALRSAFAPVRALTGELLTYLIEGTALTDPKFAAAVFESREWTDYVLIPNGTR